MQPALKSFQFCIDNINYVSLTFRPSSFFQAYHQSYPELFQEHLCVKNKQINWYYNHNHNNIVIINKCINIQLTGLRRQ